MANAPPAGQRRTRALAALVLTSTIAAVAACAPDRAPTAPTSGSPLPPQFRSAAFIFDVSLDALPKGEQIGVSESGSPGVSSSQAARVGPPGSPARSLVANDVVKLTASNFSGEQVVVDGKARSRIRFDVAITNRLAGVELITPTWPVPPAGVQGLLLLPLEVGVIKQPGDPDETPAGDRVVPSPDWDGAPFNVLDQTIGCKPPVTGCAPYEPYPAPLGPGKTLAGRTIGFDFDPSVRSFRFRLILAVDLRNVEIRPAFQVNSTADAVDANPGDGVCATAPGPDGAVCTLRAAIQEANALAGPDRIILPAGTYAITIPPATLGIEGIETGDLNITDALTITGAGAASTFLTCGGVGGCQTPAGGIFRISAGPVLITGVTLQQVPRVSDFSAVTIDSTGTAVFRSMRLVSNQSARVGGGAITNAGTLTLDSVVVADNLSGNAGGGISNSGTLTVTNSTLSGNRAATVGGAIANSGMLTIINSTLSDNTAIGTLGAQASGGGLYNSGTATLNSVAIAGNVSERFEAGGVTNSPPGVLRMSNTILSGNTARPGVSSELASSDCSGTVTSLGWNLLGSTAGCTIVGDLTGNLTGVDPLLGPLASSGGPTQTRALLTGSPAINAGNPVAPGSSPAACPANDQRGLPRLGRCDIGAYEKQTP